MAPLTIGLDYRPALSEMTGVGRYISELAAALARSDRAHQYVVFSSSFRQRLPRGNWPPNFQLVDRRIPVRLLNRLWHHHGSPPLDLLAGRAFDITHSPHPLVLPSRRGKAIVTVHDLFFYRNPEQTSSEIRRDYPRLLLDHARRAEAVITVSRTSAEEIEKELGLDRARIEVIPNGVDLAAFSPRTSPEGDQQTMARYGLSSPYAITVSTLEPRKNLPRLLLAARILFEAGFEGDLLLAGKTGMDSARINDIMARYHLEDRVRWLGYVPHSDLPVLYRQARLSVVPSLWEGFGLPLLESMASEVPVVASDIPAHREVGGEGAFYVEPTEPEAIAAGIRRVWSDDGLRQSLVRAGRDRARLFTWRETARRTQALYERLGTGGEGSRP